MRQQAPTEFLMQPSVLRPMAAYEFRHWLAILKEHFPDHPKLKVLGMSWYPGKQRADHEQRLYATMDLGPSLRVGFSDYAVGMGRLYVTVQKMTRSHGEAEFWVEPVIELRHDIYGFSPTELAEVAALLGKREDAIREAWQRYAEGARAFQRESLALLERSRFSLWHWIVSFLIRTMR